MKSSKWSLKLKTAREEGAAHSDGKIKGKEYDKEF
jgi:hypothetical protein